MTHPPSDHKTLDALARLAAGAGPPPPVPSANPNESETYTLAPAPEIAPPPLIELPNIGPPSSADPISSRRRPRFVGEAADDRLKVCLYCGYLLDTRDLRCAECGTLFAPHVYERWFGGDEERRFENVRWLLLAALFVKLWMWIPGVGNYANLLALGAIAFACWRSAEQKTEGSAGMYGIAGAVVCLLMSCLMLGSANPFQFLLECTVAGLLLAGMVTDVDRFDVLAELGYKRTALTIVFVSPALAGLYIVASWIVSKIPAFAAPPASTAVQSALVVTAVAANLFVWGYVTWTIHRISRTLFHAKNPAD